MSRLSAKWNLLLSTACLAIFLAAAPAAHALSDVYAVQFNIVKDKDEVWNFVEMISNLGYPGFMFTEENAQGAVLYYAQMGTYKDFQEALNEAERLKKVLNVEYAIVHAGSTERAMKVAENNSTPAKAPAKPVSKPVSKQTAKPAATPVAVPTTPPPAKTPPPPEPPVKNEVAHAPQAAPAQAPEPTYGSVPQTSSNKIYIVQIYSFINLDNAKKAARLFHSKGYPSFAMKLFDDDDRVWYVVCIGSADTYERAKAMGQRFFESENKSPTISQIDSSFLKTRLVEF